jgi:hypothetical protein
MDAMTSRTLALIALVGAGILAFSGCATNAPAPASSGADSGSAAELEVDAGWLDGGRMVALLTYGSSGCVPTATDVTLQADGSVAVTLEDASGDVACTADYAPRASLVALPDGVDPSQGVDLVVTYKDARGDTDLDAYAGGDVEEFTPSAGWIDDGMFAILTWGSSTCAPRVQHVAVAGDTVTVAFVDPPADQVCTMDMGPRAVLATTPDASDDATQVTLSGGGAEFATPVTVPIAAS